VTEFGIKATVYIFDRYGKLMTSLAAPGAGWDGRLNGSNMPATDYWFKAVYTQYGVTKEFKSHFSLIR
jgi:gliding motility-associated-like protein